MFKTVRQRDLWLLFLTATAVIGAGLGLRDPWPADEPRFALVAKQMVDSGDWLFPHRGTELYSDKPPVFMWLQASAYTLIGDWRIAFLLPSLLAALGTLWCVYDLGRRLWTHKAGVYAAWALLFAVQFTYQAKKAQIDPTVVFWITLANYGLLRHLLHSRLNPGPDWKMWLLGWFAAGLGTITKGVGAIALLTLVPAAFAAWRGWPGLRLHLRDVRFWLGPLALVIAVSLWLVPMLLAVNATDDPAYRGYANDILFNQTAKRYADSWDHPQPPWYHLGVIVSMWLPAMLALPWALPAWRRRLARRDARYLLPLVWAVLIVIFFSIPSGKRDVYILPALPMVCLALGPLLPGMLQRARLRFTLGWRWPLICLLAAIPLGYGVSQLELPESLQRHDLPGLLYLVALLPFITAVVLRLGVQRTTFAFAALIGSVIGLAGLAIAFDEPGLERRFVLERGLSDAEAETLAGFLLAIGLWFAGALIWFRPRRGALATAWGLAGTWVLFGLVGYPLLNRSSSASEVMTRAGRIIGPEAELGLVAWREQNLLEADRPVQTFGFGKEEHWGAKWSTQWRAAAAWQAQAPQERWLLVLEDALGPCVDRTRAKLAGTANRRRWWLVPGDALRADCIDRVSLPAPPVQD